MGSLCVKKEHPPKMNHGRCGFPMAAMFANHMITWDINTGELQSFPNGWMELEYRRIQTER